MKRMVKEDLEPKGAPKTLSFPVTVQAASATTCRPGSFSRRVFKPSRNIRWSSQRMSLAAIMPPA